jgi:carboxymethylenebutenolidase
MDGQHRNPNGNQQGNQNGNEDVNSDSASAASDAARASNPIPNSGQLSARDFDQELWNLFDKYVHGNLDRRGFLDAAGKFAVGGMTAAMVLDVLSPRFAEAQQIAPTDKRIKVSQLEIESPQGSGKIRGYLVRPAGGKRKLPAVLVVHENRGLNPHIEDVTRRMALEGFVALAPDALTTLGGYPGDEDKARELFGKLDQTKIREDFVAAAGFLKKHPDSTGKVGVVGFCYGGAIANMLASRVPDLGGAVPFYGRQATAEEAAKIKAPLLIHYAENDERVNAGAAAYEEALKAAKVKYEVHTYPGTQHGFNNDTTPRYDKAAAALAWQRTVAFFKKNLAGGAS